MSNNFYLDIFNKLLTINEQKIFILFDKDGEIWFNFKDLLTALGYINAKVAVQQLKIDEKYLKKIDNFKGVLTKNTPIRNIQPHSNMINNNGLFMLLAISKKPLAKQFMKKYIDEIMPSITTTGKYISSDKEMEKIKELNYKILQLKNDNKTLTNNQTNVIYPIGPAIYIIKQKYNNKIYYKIGYTKNLNTRIKTYNTGVVNKIHYNFYILINDPKIDTCIKNILKNVEYIKNKEFYKLTLSSIFTFIKKCDNHIKNAYCGFCQNKLSLVNAIKHNCILTN